MVARAWASGLARFVTFGFNDWAIGLGSRERLASVRFIASQIVFALSATYREWWRLVFIRTSQAETEKKQAIGGEAIAHANDESGSKVETAED